MTRPAPFRISSTAAAKGAARPLSRAAASAVSPSRSVSTVRSAEAAAPSAGVATVFNVRLAGVGIGLSSLPAVSRGPV